MKNKEQNTDYYIVPSTEVFGSNVDKITKQKNFDKTAWLIALNANLLSRINGQKKSSDSQESITEIIKPNETDWDIQWAIFKLFDESESISESISESTSVMFDKKDKIIAIFNQNPLLTLSPNQEWINILLSDRLLYNTTKLQKILSKIEQQLNTQESVAA